MSEHEDTQLTAAVTSLLKAVGCHVEGGAGTPAKVMNGRDDRPVIIVIVIVYAARHEESESGDSVSDGPSGGVAGGKGTGGGQHRY